jgi:hypothetical protein
MNSFDNPNIPFIDTLDIEILMHRDVHFSGHFDLMLEYYTQDGVGAIPDFSIKRIKKLQLEEQKLGRNLSEVLLPESAQILVQDAKQMYLDLRSIYESPSPDPLSMAISDLILSEEETPTKEIKLLCQYGQKAISFLILLLKNDKLYQPLYPGYGRAPIFIAKCLAKIQDVQAIPALFEMLGQENFFVDDALIAALVSFGDQALDFLLKRLTHKPFSKDNEQAAIVIGSFPEEEKIAKICLQVLQDPELKDHVSFANYLILGCSALKNTVDKTLFRSLKAGFPGIIQHEMELIAKGWTS